MPNLTDQRIRQKTNQEAAKKTASIRIVCRALWQSVVQTCRQRHACQPVQISPLFQNHNHKHKTNENQHEHSKVQRTKFNFSLSSRLRSKNHVITKYVNKRARTTQTTTRLHSGRPENFKFSEQCQT